MIVVLGNTNKESFINRLMEIVILCY